VLSVFDSVQIRLECINVKCQWRLIFMSSCCNILASIKHFEFKFLLYSKALGFEILSNFLYSKLFWRKDVSVSEPQV
jgi:hypothetical protein